MKPLVLVPTTPTPQRQQDSVFHKNSKITSFEPTNGNFITHLTQGHNTYKSRGEVSLVEQDTIENAS